MFQHPDHLALFAAERRALVAQAAAERAALRAHRGARPRRNLRSRLAHHSRLLGQRTRLTQPRASGPAAASRAGPP
jgi:hypothetical protein